MKTTLKRRFLIVLPLFSDGMRKNDRLVAEAAAERTHRLVKLALLAAPVGGVGRLEQRKLFARLRLRQQGC